MQEKTIKYKRGDFTVLWKPDLCMHSANCVKGSPTVFDPKKRPWVAINAEEIESIKKTIDNCPSGALSYIVEEQAETSNNDITEIKISQKGPYIINGNTKIITEDGTLLKESHKVALCRCGASQNKPFCDGAHKGIDFEG